jgi:hypothetical protein
MMLNPIAAHAAAHKWLKSTAVVPRRNAPMIIATMLGTTNTPNAPQSTRTMYVMLPMAIEPTAHASMVISGTHTSRADARGGMDARGGTVEGSAPHSGQFAPTASPSSE